MAAVIDEENLRQEALREFFKNKSNENITTVEAGDLRDEINEDINNLNAARKNLDRTHQKNKANLQKHQAGSHEAKLVAETVKTDEMLLMKNSARILALNEILNLIKGNELFTESVKIKDLQHWCLAAHMNEAKLKELNSKDPFDEVIREQCADGNWKSTWNVIAFIKRVQPKFRLDIADVLKMACPEYTHYYLATILVIYTLQTYYNDKQDQWKEAAHRGEQYLAKLQVEGDDRNFIIKVFKFYGL